MNRLSPQRRKVVIVAAIIPCFTMPAMMISQRLHGVPLRVFVIGYALSMATLLVYVMTQLVKLKRTENQPCQKAKA